MIRSLQQRLTLFLLLPTALLLVGMGLAGFIYARGIMLAQWRESAILKLQRAAHHIDMRMAQPVQWLEMFKDAADQPNSYRLERWLLQQLKKLEGVLDADLTWVDGQAPGGGTMMMGRAAGSMGMRRFFRARISDVSVPVFDPQKGEETVAMLSNLVDEEGKTVGRFTLTMSFEYLMQDILTLGWWQGDTACLVDMSGRLLARTRSMKGGPDRLGKGGNSLEKAVLETMRKKPSGTVLGPGAPPKEVAGFYKIKEAPWVLVLFAPGEKILAPIIRFRLYYVVSGMILILVVLLLIRFVAGKMVRSIEKISGAAEMVAAGQYGEPLPVKTRDEVGRLIDSFNEMVKGLKERDFISNTFGRYVDREIARELMQRPEASRLGGQKREVAILMSDLRGFTALSETLTPDVTISMLNRYFSYLIKTIQNHRGIIVDFFGDALLVFFDPLDGSVAPTIEQALSCAFEMQEVMKTYNRDNLSEGLPELLMGIGLNAGEVVVGNIGSEARAKYGIVGSAVNLASRIQAEAGEGEVVITQRVCDLAEGSVVVKRSFAARLKGIQGEVRLYVVDPPEEKV